jgi:PBP1b-binding outer membrane lipoprotein LpoB
MKIHHILILLVAFLLFGCSSNQTAANTPSDAVRAYVDSYNRRDIEGMKQTFSADTMKMYEIMAQRDKTSVNRVIEGQFKATPANMQTLEMEIGKEEITVDTATVETKNKTTSEAAKMPCVKENGQWKLALDKLIKEILKKSKPST